MARSCWPILCWISAPRRPFLCLVLSAFIVLLSGGCFGLSFISSFPHARWSPSRRDGRFPCGTNNQTRVWFHHGTFFVTWRFMGAVSAVRDGNARGAKVLKREKYADI